MDTDKPLTSSILRLGRTMLAEAIREGVPEPEELEPDVLIRGASHHIFTGAGQGKTWVALWLIKRAIQREQTVIYFDAENGKRIISERLQLLNVGEEVDDYLYYFDFPAMVQQDYALLLDEVQPDLLVFDSWVGFLAACGLSEDSNDDVEQWSNAYINPAKARGCTILMLDHVGHKDAERSRGAARKKDYMDVQWILKKVQHFDRTNVGFVQLKLKKDREAWLQPYVGFSIGGTEDGLVCERSTGTVQGPGDGLTDSARVALAALEKIGDKGATYAEWRKAIIWKGGEMPDTTFRRARNELVHPDVNKVRQDGDRYYSHHSQTTATAVTAVGQ